MLEKEVGETRLVAMSLAVDGWSTLALRDTFDPC